MSKGVRRTKWGFGATDRQRKKRKVTKEKTKRDHDVEIDENQSSATLPTEAQKEAEGEDSDAEIDGNQSSATLPKKSQDDAEGEDSDVVIDENQSSASREDMEGEGSSSDDQTKDGDDHSLDENKSEDWSSSETEELPDDGSEQPLSVGLSPEQLSELQRKHETEKGVHFYEIVMAAALNIPLERTMTLSKFAEYVADYATRQTKPRKQFNITLNLFGRTLPGVHVLHCRKDSKNIERYSVIDGHFLVDIFEKQSRSLQEWNFLKTVREMVACGDFSGVPLVLAECMDAGLATIILPDYGHTLSRFFKNYSRVINNQTLGLSLLAMFCSLPFENSDLHERNVCIYKPDINFCYKWTIQINNYLFELSWNFYGLLTTIDWESCRNFPNPVSLSQSTYTPFSRQLWQVKIKEGYHAYGIPSCLTDTFKGENGMFSLLYNVFTHFDRDQYNVKLVSLKGTRKDILTSTLQVFPSQENVGRNFDKMLRKTWNRKMSETGSVLKIQKCLTEANIIQMQELYQSFCKNREDPDFNVPSDTGLVGLTKNRVLVAKKDIAKGDIVTHIPITKTELFDSQQIWLQSVQGSIFKKLSPFCGFGAFATFNSEKANCTIDVSGSKGTFVCLIATKPISFGDAIISDTTCLVKKMDSHDSEIICDLSIIMEMVKSNISPGPETRSSSRQRPNPDECEHL